MSRVATTLRLTALGCAMAAVASLLPSTAASALSSDLWTFLPAGSYSSDAEVTLSARDELVVADPRSRVVDWYDRDGRRLGHAVSSAAFSHVLEASSEAAVLETPAGDLLVVGPRAAETTIDLPPGIIDVSASRGGEAHAAVDAGGRLHTVIAGTLMPGTPYSEVYGAPMHVAVGPRQAVATCGDGLSVYSRHDDALTMLESTGPGCDGIAYGPAGDLYVSWIGGDLVRYASDGSRTALDGPTSNGRGDLTILPSGEVMWSGGADQGVHWAAPDGREGDVHRGGLSGLGGYTSSSTVDSAGRAYVVRRDGGIDGLAASELTVRMLDGYPVIPIAAATVTRLEVSPHWSGPAGPRSFSVVSGTLPPGVVLDAQSGRLTGVPTAQGSFAFTVAMEDGRGAASTADVSITVGSARRGGY